MRPWGNSWGTAQPLQQRVEVKNKENRRLGQGRGGGEVTDLNILTALTCPLRMLSTRVLVPLSNLGLLLLSVESSLYASDTGIFQAVVLTESSKKTPVY